MKRKLYYGYGVGVVETRERRCCELIRQCPVLCTVSTWYSSRVGSGIGSASRAQRPRRAAAGATTLHAGRPSTRTMLLLLRTSQPGHASASPFTRRSSWTRRARARKGSQELARSSPGGGPAFIGDSLLRARPPELALAARPAATGMAAQRGSDGPADAGRAAGARDHAARR